MIERFISQFTSNNIPDIVKVGKQYYQMSAELKSLMEKIDKKINRTAVSAGLFLGEEKVKDFRPSPALIEMLGPMTARWVVIDDKAEWLFLCGRDVFATSVVKANVDDGLVIVMNSRKEVLGYGKMTGREVSIKNLLDKGDYLRREMTKKHHKG